MRVPDPLTILATLCFLGSLYLGTRSIYRFSDYKQRLEREAYDQAYDWALRELSQGHIDSTLLEARVQKRLRQQTITAFDRGVLDALRDFTRSQQEQANKQIAGEK